MKKIFCIAVLVFTGCQKENKKELVIQETKEDSISIKNLEYTSWTLFVIANAHKVGNSIERKEHIPDSLGIEGGQNLYGAITYFTNEINANRKLGESFACRGMAKSGLQDYKGAIEDYTKAIAIEPSRGIYESRADSKSNLQDFRGAVDDYSMAIGDYQKDIFKTTDTIDELVICRLYKKRGDVKYKLQDYGGAMIDYNKPVDILPNAKNYANRGDLKFELKDYRGAITDYNNASNYQSCPAYVYYNRGSAKINLRQNESACLDFSKAGELGDSDAYDAIKKYCK